MIVFDLDGTLALCEHRRHFVDPSKDPYVVHGIPPSSRAGNFAIMRDYNKNTGEIWKPNWRGFYDACDKDEPNLPIIRIWNDQISLGAMGINQIWSGRCESVREKTEKWLNDNLLCFDPSQLKMRPIGDNTPDDQLKEKWLREAISEGKTIDMVFDDRDKVVAMWRRNKITCLQVAPGDF